MSDEELPRSLELLMAVALALDAGGNAAARRPTIPGWVYDRLTAEGLLGRGRFVTAEGYQWLVELCADAGGEAPRLQLVPDLEPAPDLTYQGHPVIECEYATDTVATICPRVTRRLINARPCDGCPEVGK